jgi:FkbM family methyltransferase
MNVPNRGSKVLCIVLALAAGAVVAACGDAERDAILTQEKLYSQFNEELVIRHFFNDRRDGFFLDVGSYHARQSSTTYYLEEKLGWSGIAIDAQVAFAGSYEKHRKNTRFFSYLVSDKSGESQTLYRAGPLSSTDKDHLKSFQEHPDVFPGLENIKAVPVEVPTITLDDLLVREGVEKIDFMSMDIEGSEPPALKGFDIERFQPALVCIEVGEKTQDAVTAYFAAHDYEHLTEYVEYDTINWYFAPRNR